MTRRHVPLIHLLALAVLAAMLVALAQTASSGAAAKKPGGAVLSLAKVRVADGELAISGRASLPKGLTAKQRRGVRILLTLRDGAGKTERFSARLDDRRRFATTRRTGLRGTLRLVAVARVAGKQSGAAATRTVRIVRGGGTSGGGGGGGEASQPVPLRGTFVLDPGIYSGGRATGTYFRMIQPDGASPLPNPNSTASDQTYTLLRPGIDGGLRTDAYQEPPGVPFASGGAGDALANRIVLPQGFFGFAFSVVTAATDAQTGAADPLPQISHLNGKLTGQVTAWVAQWNGLSFNQGTPKPDGTRPAPTSELSGTYDPLTRRFALEWRSLIVGGPFNSFSGFWHLEGTFQPAG